jgi:hypothetical protein
MDGLRLPGREDILSLAQRGHELTHLGKIHVDQLAADFDNHARVVGRRGTVIPYV